MQDLTLETVLINIRNRMSQAIERDERRLLSDMKTAMTMLLEAAEGTEDMQVFDIMLRLEWVARESTMGFPVGEEMPSVKVIRAAFDRTQRTAND